MPHLGRVGPDEVRLGQTLDPEAQAAVLRHGPDQRRRIVHERAQVHRLEAHLLTAGLHAREAQDLVDELEQVQRAREHVPELVPLVLRQRTRDLRLQQVRARDDRGERRLQLVRHHRKEVRLRLARGQRGLVQASVFDRQRGTPRELLRQLHVLRTVAPPFVRTHQRDRAEHLAVREQRHHHRRPRVQRRFDPVHLRIAADLRGPVLRHLRDQHRLPVAQHARHHAGGIIRVRHQPAFQLPEQRLLLRIRVRRRDLPDHAVLAPDMDDAVVRDVGNRQRGKVRERHLVIERHRQRTARLRQESRTTLRCLGLRSRRPVPLADPVEPRLQVRRDHRHQGRDHGDDDQPLPRARVHERLRRDQPVRVVGHHDGGADQTRAHPAQERGVHDDDDQERAEVRHRVRRHELDLEQQHRRQHDQRTAHLRPRPPHRLRPARRPAVGGGRTLTGANPPAARGGPATVPPLAAPPRGSSVLCFARHPCSLACSGEATGARTDPAPPASRHMHPPGPNEDPCSGKRHASYHAVQGQ